MAEILHQLRLVVYPIIYKVVQDFSHQHVLVKRSCCRKFKELGHDTLGYFPFLPFRKEKQPKGLFFLTASPKKKHGSKRNCRVPGSCQNGSFGWNSMRLVGIFGENCEFQSWTTSSTSVWVNFCANFFINFNCQIPQTFNHSKLRSIMENFFMCTKNQRSLGSQPFLEKQLLGTQTKSPLRNQSSTFSYQRSGRVQAILHLFQEWGMMSLNDSMNHE